MFVFFPTFIYLDSLLIIFYFGLLVFTIVSYSIESSCLIVFYCCLDNFSWSCCANSIVLLLCFLALFPLKVFTGEVFWRFSYAIYLDIEGLFKLPYLFLSFTDLFLEPSLLSVALEGLDVLFATFFSLGLALKNLI